MDVLSDPTYNIIPPSILIGIVDKERNKDLNAFREESGKKFMKHLFEEHKLWENPKSAEPAGLDPVNIANAYYMMGDTLEVIRNWNKALE